MVRGCLTAIAFMALAPASLAATHHRKLSPALGAVRQSPNERIGIAVTDPGNLDKTASDIGRVPRELRQVIDLSDVQLGEANLRQDLTFAETHMGYRLGTKSAPIEVTFNPTWTAVRMASGTDFCNTGAPTFSKRLCSVWAVRLVTWATRQVLSDFPMIKRIDGPNEMGNLGTPTAQNIGSERLAVQLWQAMAKVATSLHSGISVLPGDAWIYPSTYMKNYFRDVTRIARHRHWKIKGVVIHPYKDILCNAANRPENVAKTLNSMKSLIKNLRADRIYNSVRTHYGIDANEVATDLSPSVIVCSNAQAMSATINDGSAIRSYAVSEWRSGAAILRLGDIDRRMPIRAELYLVDDPRCPMAKWDSSLVAPNGGQRILWWLLRGVSPPVWLMNPDSSQRFTAAETLVAPSNWPDCNYGNVQPPPAAPTTPIPQPPPQQP